MKRITLTIKEKNEQGKVVQTEQDFTIDKLSFGQILKLTGEVGSIMKDFKGNDDLKDVIEGLMGDFSGGENNNEQDDGQSGQIKDETLEKMKDGQFINGLAGAFDKLIETMPQRAEHILAIASDIPVETLRKSYGEEIFDVYDAIIEENDVVKLANRMKKSFNQTRKRWVETTVSKATQ